MDKTTFTLPAYDGITFNVTHGDDDPDTPDNWLVITGTDIDGNEIPNFRVGFRGP